MSKSKASMKAEADEETTQFYVAIVPVSLLAKVEKKRKALGQNKKGAVMKMMALYLAMEG